MLSLFTLADWGVDIDGAALTGTGPVFPGITLVLFVGKPVDIFLVTYSAVQLVLSRALTLDRRMAALGKASRRGSWSPGISQVDARWTQSTPLLPRPHQVQPPCLDVPI